MVVRALKARWWTILPWTAGWWGWQMLPAGAEPTVQEQVATAQVAADTAFMSSCTSLVLLMTVGLAFFY
ncbi:MAG: hypothetical protein ACKO5Q_21070, partial [Microcystaceae cyanobacterium]